MINSENSPRRRRGPFGCLIRQLMLIIITLAIAFGASAACFLFAPFTFQSVINILRSAGYKSYVFVLSVTGSPALKIITYDVDVTAVGQVSRDLGALSLLYGEGAQVMGTMRVSLGADLKSNKFGIMACDIDASTIRTTVGRAPLSNSAYDPDQIKQQAYLAFEKEASKQSLSKYWTEARTRLKQQFVSWGLGLEIPEQATLIDCPSQIKSDSTKATPTPVAQ